jgi:thioesterase domain-containing protein
MVDPDELQRYLHAKIPLSRALGLNVIRADRSGVSLAAPLAPNVNHRDTVFGGSIVSVAILSCWSLVWVRMQEDGPGSRIVIHRSEMEYQAPLHGDFVATAEIPSEARWRRFVDMVRRKGRGRIHLDAMVADTEGQVAGVFHGHYVALAPGN